MAESNVATVVLEALRHRLEHDAHGAVALLERRGGDILRGGQAVALWQLLAPRLAPALAYWRLRCAVDLGWVDRQHVAEPPADAHAARLLWGKLLFRRAQFAECAAAMRALAADAQARRDDAMVFEAQIVCAEALGYSGLYNESLATLESASAPDVVATARRDALRARWLVHRGTFDDAPQLALSAAALLPQVPESDRTAVAAEVLGVFLYLTPQLVASIVPLDETAETDATALFDPRAYRTARCMVLLNAGRVAEARAILRELRPERARRSVERLYLDLQDVLARIMTGELADLHLECERVMSQAEAVQNVEVYYWVLALRERLAVLFASDFPDLPPSLRLPGAPAIVEDFLRGARYQRALRKGQRTNLGAGWRADTIASVQMLRASLRAEEALFGGTFDHARRHLSEAIELAHDNARVLQEAELHELACALEVVAGSDERLRESVAALDALAGRFGSPRFAAEVRFFEAVLACGFPTPEVLESLATLEWVAPPACRRARPPRFTGPARCARRGGRLLHPPAVGRRDRRHPRRRGVAQRLGHRRSAPAGLAPWGQNDRPRPLAAPLAFVDDARRSRRARVEGDVVPARVG